MHLSRCWFYNFLNLDQNSLSKLNRSFIRSSRQELMLGYMMKKTSFHYVSVSIYLCFTSTLFCIAKQNEVHDVVEEFTYSQENLSKLLPSLRIFPKFKEPKEGETVQLVCTTNNLDPDPDPKLIQWTFEPLPDRTQLRTKSPQVADSLPSNVTTLGNVLIVWSMSKEHLGIYRCTVQLKEFNLTAQASAELAPRPTIETSPQVFISPELIRLSPNSSAKVQCEITGHPPSKIIWYRLENGDRPMRLIGSEQDQSSFNNDVSPSITIDGVRTEYLPYNEAMLFCVDGMLPCKATGTVTGISFLHIEKSQAEHQGQYVCRASNSQGSNQASTIVDVEFGEAPHVRIPDKMRDQTVLLDGTTKVSATFECIVDSGKPMPKVRWLRPSVNYDLKTPQGFDAFDLAKVSSVTSNVTTLIGDDGKTFSFSITTNSLNDQGEYVCLAENEWGKHSALARLHIRKSVSVRIFQPSPFVTRLNESFQFECIASGYPLPLDIEWSRQDKGVYFSLISRQQGNLDESQEKAVLKFDRVSADESGEYTCNARDPSEPSKVLRDTIMLLVEDSSKQENKGRFPSTNSLLPRLLVRPTRTTAMLGSNVTLDCLAVSGLQPTIVEWIPPPGLALEDLSLSISNNLSDSIDLRSSQIRPYYRNSRFNTASNRMVQFGSKLKVFNLSKSHEGVYQCKGHNKVGVEIAPALIKVTDMSEYLDSKHEGNFHSIESDRLPASESNQTKIAKAGSNIELKCQVDGINQPVTSWSREGMELPKSSVQIDHNLWIKNVSEDDNGLYICSARPKTPNRLIQAKINLLVQGTHDRGMFSDLSAKIVASKSNIHPGDSITLECIISKLNSSIQSDLAYKSPKLLEELAEIEDNVVWTNLHSGQSVFQDNVYIQNNLLIIYDIRHENSATYRCNYHDLSQYTDYKLSVPGHESFDTNNPDWQIPRLSVNQQFLQVAVGGQLSIDCIQSDSGIAYHWARGIETNLIQLGHQNKPMLIEDVSADMADWYHCLSGASSSTNSGETRILRSFLVQVIVPVARFTQRPVSFISLPTISGADHQLNLELKILPERDHGLILFNGQQSVETNSLISAQQPSDNMQRPMSTGDYILLGLNRGYIEFRFELGDGVTLLRSSQPVAMNQWHRLVIERNRQGAIMWVDQQPPVKNSSMGKFFNLNLDSVLYVGGSQFFLNRANSNRSSMRFFGYSKGFQGCISQLRISRNEINLMAKNRIVSFGIYECDKPECPKDVCGSNGFCQVDKLFKANMPMNATRFSSPSSDLRCICMAGFTGEHCDDVIDTAPARIANNNITLHGASNLEGSCDKLKPCSPDGTLNCESLSQTSFKCHCRLGYIDRTCSQTVTFIDDKVVRFNEQSFVQIRFNKPEELFDYIRRHPPNEDSQSIAKLTPSTSGSNVNNQFNSTILSQLSSMAEQQNISLHINTESKYGLLFYMGQVNFYDTSSTNLTWPTSLETGSDLSKLAPRASRTKSVVANLLTRLSRGSNLDFLALALVDGHLELSYELGSGLAIIRSSERFNDGQWHHIIVNRAGLKGQLTIDDSHTYKGNSPGKLSVLNTQSSDFFLGGLPQPISDHTTSSNIYLSGFTGCIRDVRINSLGPLNLIKSDHLSQLRAARNLEPCDQTPIRTSHVTTKPIQLYKPYKAPKAESDDPDEM